MDQNEEKKIAKRRYAKQYYEQNKERIREYNRKRWAEQKDLLAERNHEYYMQHREERIAAVMQWEHEHRPYVRVKDNEYYHKNANKINARRRERYARAKLEKVKTFDKDKEPIVPRTVMVV